MKGGRGAGPLVSSIPTPMILQPGLYAKSTPFCRCCCIVQVFRCYFSSGMLKVENEDRCSFCVRSSGLLFHESWLIIHRSVYVPSFSTVHPVAVQLSVDVV